MRAAPLPAGAGQRRPDRLDQAAVSVGGHEPDPGQAARSGRARTRATRRRHRAGDLQAHHLPVPIGVHAGRDQRVHVHHAATLAHLEHQRVRGDDVYGPASRGRERKSATRSSSSAAIAETCNLLSLVIPRDSTSFSIRRVDTPSR